MRRLDGEHRRQRGDDDRAAHHAMPILKLSCAEIVGPSFASSSLRNAVVILANPSSVGWISFSQSFLLERAAEIEMGEEAAGGVLGFEPDENLVEGVDHGGADLDHHRVGDLVPRELGPQPWSRHRPAVVAHRAIGRDDVVVAVGEDRNEWAERLDQCDVALLHAGDETAPDRRVEVPLRGLRRIVVSHATGDLVTGDVVSAAAEEEEARLLGEDDRLERFHAAHRSAVSDHVRDGVAAELEALQGEALLVVDPIDDVEVLWVVEPRVAFGDDDGPTRRAGLDVSRVAFRRLPACHGEMGARRNRARDRLFERCVPSSGRVPRSCGVEARLQTGKGMGAGGVVNGTSGHKSRKT